MDAPHFIRAFLALLLLTSARAGDASASITAIASLTDPKKIATLSGKRAANDRLHKILAWLEEGRREFVHPSKIIDEAQKLNGDTPAHAAAVKETLLWNFDICTHAAVFTDDNLARMKEGRAPLVTGGTYSGEPYHVDHIIPVAEFPTLGNEIANLIYLPRTLNLRKSDEIKQRAIDLANKLIAAGILTKNDMARLYAIRRWGSDPAPKASPKPTAATPGSGSVVNLNTASAAEMEGLPGIGPKTAAGIIAARPLRDFDDLDKVPGVGTKTLEALRDLVSF